MFLINSQIAPLWINLLYQRQLWQWITWLVTKLFMLHMHAIYHVMQRVWGPLRRLTEGRNRQRTGVFLEVTEPRHRHGAKFSEPCWSFSHDKILNFKSLSFMLINIEINFPLHSKHTTLLSKVILCRKITGVYFEDHMTYCNKFCGQNSDFENYKLKFWFWKWILMATEESTVVDEKSTQIKVDFF
jgi:hypothetical protein